MRSLFLAAAVAAAVVTGTLPGVVSPPPVSAATAPKVAIIVGPVGGSTAGYKRDADAAAAEALKYTPNVVKVYTPNATWEAAKAAMQGASIVIYMGHGNGFPSPYTTTLAPDRQNGLGVNPTAGVNDTTTKYYGEQFLRNEVRLAPGAIVIFGHLCYASGSSEPGKADPTLDQAQQRVDNYASGFLAIGARAVIAEAYNGASAAYVSALFTTRQTVFEMWRTSRTGQGAPFAFPSTRTPGMTAQMDPDKGSGKYYRAIVGDPTLTTEQVTGGTYTPGTTTPPPVDPTTPSDPGVPVDPNSPVQVAPAPPSQPSVPLTFSVPGAAMVAVDGAPVFADASLALDPATGGPAATLPIGTPVRILTAAGAAPDGTAAYGVSAAGGAVTGFMLASTLQPADSLAPVLLSMSAPSAFSPNGDGVLDTVSLSATLNEASNWDLTIQGSGGTPVATERGNGATAFLTWDGSTGGARVPDGAYSWRVTASDPWGNGPVTRTGSVVVDTVPPPMTTSTSLSTPVTISPNGDGANDQWVAKFALGGAGGGIDGTVRAADGTAVRYLSTTTTSSTATLIWNGRADDGSAVADGSYMITVSGRDAAGNVAPATSYPIVVYRALGAVTASASVFYPHDRDALAPSTRLGFTLVQPATVSWKIVDAAGQTILTKYAGVSFQPRSISMVWAGLDQAGALVPPGRYESILTVTNGILSETVRTNIVASGFSLTSSVSTVSRGGSVTITAVSAEPLKSSPKLSYLRPGLSLQTYTMSKVSTNTYRLVIRLSNTGKPGTMAFKVTGFDTRGGTNASTLDLPLR